MLVDVHAHLTHEQFSKDLPLVIKRSKGMKIICAGSGHKDNQAVMRICSENTNIYPSLGLYPWDAVTMTEGEIDFCIDYIKNNAQKVACIGEIGLDYHWGQGRDDLDKQAWVFNKMLELALEINKPVLIHCRKAEHDVLKMIKEYEGEVIIHSYTGPQTLVSDYVKLGCSFSIPAVIVRSSSFKKLVKEVPINQLLTETDSPYLSPVAGERNEPLNVKQGIKAVAEVKGLSENKAEDEIYKNFERIFKVHLLK